MMRPVEVSIINACGPDTLSDSDIRAIVPALQKQVERDFAPVWGRSAHLSFVPKNKQPKPSSWWLAILNDSKYAGITGYHDLTTERLPLGKVFAATMIEHGVEWTVTASHELLEMLADPDLSLGALLDRGGSKSRFYCYEVCDPCEDDSQSYKIDGVRISDFVHPTWFESFRRRGGVRFDQCRLIDRPFKFLRGGCALVRELPSRRGLLQLRGEGNHFRLTPLPGGRRSRRGLPRDRWMPSTIKFGR
jgi:hypothetical protein